MQTLKEKWFVLGDSLGPAHHGEEGTGGVWSWGSRNLLTSQQIRKCEWECQCLSNFFFSIFNQVRTLPRGLLPPHPNESSLLSQFSLKIHSQIHHRSLCEMTLNLVRLATENNHHSRFASDYEETCNSPRNLELVLQSI